MIDTLGVVVPAHDEQELLPTCLAALHEAVQVVAAARPGLRTRLIVAADACTDGTAALARAAGAEVTEVTARNVGRARAAGVQQLLGSGGSPERLWIASTDADSVVPPDWLKDQIQYAEQRWDAVIGTVAVSDWSGHAPATVREYGRRYGTWQDWHPHVHGANLGVGGRAYQAAGGFPPLATGEDRALVAALTAAGHRVLRIAGLRVVTSARHGYRAPAGFGQHLANLGGMGSGGHV